MRSKRSSPPFPIDVVILWVDGNDQEWQRQKEYYLGLEPKEAGRISASVNRYRDWGLLKYIFRGIEQYAPWVNQVLLVTNGQKPAWLDEQAEGFRLVRHEDFIPKECLPTFSSQAIDLNLWRIPDLSEHFIYMNDDMFLTHPVAPEDFFHHGMPRDVFSERPVFSGDPVFQCNMLMNICALGRHYQRKEVLRKNRGKILNLRYGSLFFYNLLWYCLPFRKFCGLYMNHLPMAYRKSQWERTWHENRDVCEQTIRHKFRTVNDVNQFLYNMDSLLSGEFWPASMQRQGCKLDITGENTKELCQIIESGRWKRLLLNDNCDDQAFEGTRSALKQAFDQILPEKSHYEKAD